MRVKEPASNWKPEEEDDEELVWQRLRAQQAGTARARATSDVVPRTSVGQGSSGGDPYGHYADYVQREAPPGYGSSAFEEEGLFEEAEGAEEDDETVWERLRTRADGTPRVSDIAALGTHHAYDSEDEYGNGDEWEETRQAYEQQAYEQQQQAYAQQQHAYAQQQHAYAQQQAYEQQQHAYAQQQAYEQQQHAYAQQQAYEQQQQAYAQQQHAYAQHQAYEQAAYAAEQAWARQQAYGQQQAVHAQQAGWGQQPQTTQQPYAQHQAYGQQQPYAPQSQPHGMAANSRAALQQTWTGQIPDFDLPKPRRKKRGLAYALLAGSLIAGGFALAPQLLHKAAPTVMQSPTSVATANVGAVGLEEARARDAVFGTHTAPPSEPTPSVATPEPAPSEAPTVAPSEPAPSEPHVAASPTKVSKAKVTKTKAKVTKPKAKPKKVAQAARNKPVKKAKESSDRSGLSGVARQTDDPLDGI